MKGKKAGGIRLAVTGLVLLLILVAVAVLPRWGRGVSSADLSRYDYRATRALVAGTLRAAGAVARDGEGAFARFRESPDDWVGLDSAYLYVYDLEGNNLYHGGYPQFVGKNLQDFHDLLGKQPCFLIAEQLTKQAEINPHGWIHYLWARPGWLEPSWKSSCNFLVTMPDGRRVYVGSGIDDSLPEREYFRIVVDEAAELIKAEGQKALARLHDSSGPFTIYDKGIFVLDRKGNVLLDPGFNESWPRNLFRYRDLAGQTPWLSLSKKLDDDSSAWVIFLKQKGDKAIKEAIYGRRAVMDGEPVILGIICGLPEPAWMN